MGRVKEETIKGLFVRVFNRLDISLGDYKAELEREKITEFDDEEIEKLIQQERALYFMNTDHNPLHEELIDKLTKLQVERATWMAERAKQDTRIARTLELEAILESRGGRITEFSEDLYTEIIEKIIVKERTALVFHLKNGLAFEERYSLKRGHDIL